MLRHGNGMLLNYSELPQALETRVARHFGIDMSDADSAALRAVSNRHSKRTDETFRPDAAQKRSSADAVVLELTARWLNEPYLKLAHA